MNNDVWMEKGLLAALLLLALSGFMLHVRIHFFMSHYDPALPGFNTTYFLSNLLPFLDVTLVPLLFSSRKTAVYGYVLNGMIVIYGTVLMAHYSIAELTAKSVPIEEWLIKSTIPDIGIAWGDFFIGKALYDLYMKGQLYIHQPSP